MGVSGGGVSARRFSRLSSAHSASWPGSSSVLRGRVLMKELYACSPTIWRVRRASQQLPTRLHPLGFERSGSRQATVAWALRRTILLYRGPEEHSPPTPISRPRIFARQCATRQRQSASASFRLSPAREIPDRRRALAGPRLAAGKLADTMRCRFATTGCERPATMRSSSAQHERRVIVSGDTDFGTLLALRRERSPSVVLFRHGTQRRPEQQSQILLANLATIEHDLAHASIVVVEPDRMRARALPLNP
jgi:hypothetical protein